MIIYFIKDLKIRKREQFRLNTEVLDLEKQIYEEEETFRVKLQYAEVSVTLKKRVHLMKCSLYL